MMLFPVLIIGVAILGIAGVFAQLSIRDNTTAMWQRLPLWVPLTIMGLGAVLLIWGLMWGWSLSPSDTL
jgi:hypothetical protein